ncbi:MAG: U32 family peptidase [Geobacteraceae bacterium]|nr:U32 family peptidase [Geobacteraceae bacterium]
MPPVPELLAPAGDIDKLKVALDYGADAVYLGGEHFGLRAQAGNFNLENLRRAVEETHKRGKKLYLTLNAYLFETQMHELDKYLEALRPLDIDAYIVSDPGVLNRIRTLDTQREIHLSTQANTLNAAACNFWSEQGIERVNLGRELSLQDISAIHRGTQMGLEVFVHGAMCVAYSGRCLLSTALTGRSANSGACAQPCRWNYTLVEETRPQEAFGIEEDKHGTYIMNSRDLCLLEHIPDLIRAGVKSLKIEGRMKTLYYVAAVTRVYRAAIDAYMADPHTYRCDPLWREELDKVSHRPYTTDFLPPDDATIHHEDSRYRRSHDFLGIVREQRSATEFLVEGRNRFECGDPIEVIGPGMRQRGAIIHAARTQKDEPRTIIQPNAMVWVELPSDTRPGDMLRREKPADQRWSITPVMRPKEA